MKIVEAIISNFAIKILNDMEQTADSIERNADATPIQQAQQGIKNQSKINKLANKQTLLSFFKNI